MVTIQNVGTFILYARQTKGLLDTREQRTPTTPSERRPYKVCEYCDGEGVRLVNFTGQVGDHQPVDCSVCGGKGVA